MENFKRFSRYFGFKSSKLKWLKSGQKVITKWSQSRRKMAQIGVKKGSKSGQKVAKKGPKSDQNNLVDYFSCSTKIWILMV